MKKHLTALTFTIFCAISSAMAMDPETGQPVGKRFILVPKNEILRDYTCSYQLEGLDEQPAWLKMQIGPRSAFTDKEEIKKVKAKEQSKYKIQGYSRKDLLSFEIRNPEEQDGHLTSALEWYHTPYNQYHTTFPLTEPEYFLQTVVCAGVVYVNLNQEPCYTEGDNQYYIGHIQKRIVDPYKDVPRDINLVQHIKFRSDFATDEAYETHKAWFRKVEYEQAAKWTAAVKNFRENTLHPLKKEILEQILVNHAIPTAVEDKDEALSYKLDLQQVGNAQSITRDEKGIKVVTDHNNHASYQLESNRFDVVMGQEIRISYKITVEEGGIMSLGLLNTARNGWYGEELILKAGHHEDMYTRIVPSGETKTSLVFRNYHGIREGGPGQTTFTIHNVDFKIK